jgi:glycosyltransferase involved in cell wall biosynthesis
VRALYTRYPHWGAYSGVKQLFRHLDPSRFAIDAHAVSDDDGDFPRSPSAVRERLRARVQRRGMPWYKLSDLAAELRALPGCLLGRADIVHFFDGEHSAQYLPRWLKGARLGRPKLVATYHQMPDMLEGLLAKDVVARLDHVTLVSPAQLPYFRVLLPADRVQVILYGIDTDFFAPPPSREKQATAFTTITTGHWMRDWTAVRAVAEAFRAEPSFTFHVVTDRPTGLDDVTNVVIHRNVDDATLRALYQAADCLFLPLLGATANNALLEGIACGLPVVSTALPSVRAYLPGGEAILVDRNDPRLLGDALVRLRRDAGLRTTMGVRARARAEELSWARVARDYERLYARLAGFLPPGGSAR